MAGNARELIQTLQRGIDGKPLAEPFEERCLDLFGGGFRTDLLHRTLSLRYGGSRRRLWSFETISGYASAGSHRRWPR
jgi:hypothetical protein